MPRSERFSGVTAMPFDCSSFEALLSVTTRLVALPIRFHPVTRELADIAARFKASHPISLADAFAAALAKTRNTELVTGDRDFKAVESDLKKIRWLK